MPMVARWMVVLGMVATGCGGSDAAPDAAPGAPDAALAIDAAPSIDAGPDAMPSASDAHILYLHFTGEVIRAGFESAVNNTSTLVSGVRTGVPYPHTQLIDGIVAEVTTLVAPYDIRVVTERPPIGPYHMVLFGGAPATMGFSSGIQATAPQACGHIQNSIAFVFDQITDLHTITANVVALDAIVHGVPTSALAGDCLCFEAGACSVGFPSTCVIGGAGTPMSAQTQCETVAPFDPHARMLAAFGAHP